MIEGFDKEIDALLRQTANGEIASANFQSKIQNPKAEIHLGADEIAAFAENALAEKTRVKYIAHFADCNRCRTILANVISLNAEAETVAASSIIAPQTVETKPLPWYRRLFAAPSLAYAMGALVVLFGGFFAFLVVQNTNNSRSAEVSQVAESRPASGPSFDEETDFSAANTMSNTSATSANSVSNAMMSNAATMANSTASLSNSMAAPPTAERTANANIPAAPKPVSAAKEAPLNETARETEMSSAQSKSAAPVTDATAGNVADNEVAAKNQADTAAKQEADKSKLADRAVEALPLNSRNANELKMTRDKKAKSNVKETDARVISGKNFTRKDNVWYDSAYNGQSTTNVRRNSDDYKKLDSGLRSIADGLGETVVIVWKNKAYRIQ